MARYQYPAQFVKATIETRFRDFLRDERRQTGLGAEMITLEDGTRVTARTRLALQIEIDGETVDRPIADGVDAYAAADVRIDIEHVADRIDPKFLQAIQDSVIDDEKAVVVAKREGVAHTTIAHRVKRGQKEFAELLGDGYELGAR
jgi:DNA-directed RNA polymerase specialized sigma24 family protein